MEPIEVMFLLHGLISRKHKRSGGGMVYLTCHNWAHRASYQGALVE